MKKYILFLILIASLSLNSSLIARPIGTGPIGGGSGGGTTDRMIEGTTLAALTVGDTTPEVFSKGNYDCTGATTVLISDFSGTFSDGDFFFLTINDADVTIDCSDNAEIECNVNTDFTGSASQIEKHLFIYEGGVWNSSTLTQGKSTPTTLAIDTSQAGFYVIASAGSITVTAAQMNSVIFMTAAGEVLIPDVCDSATGGWLKVFNKTATNQVEVAVADTGNDKFVLIDGTALDVDDEADLSTNASSWAKFECYEANTWYITAGVGSTTDGGVAD